MRPETRKQVREAVLYDMAPAQSGQVTLEDVARVFRGKAQVEEVEECLGDLVKDGLAEKTEFSGRTYYVFEGMATEAAAHNERRIREIEAELAFLQEEEEKIESLLKEESLALLRLRPVWLSGWEGSRLGADEISKIQSYVSIKLSHHLQKHYRRQHELGAKTLDLEEERKRRLKWKEETFITVRTS